jgi:trans-aconitate methyltransferase
MNIGNSDDSEQWSEETSRLFINYGSYFVPEREHQIEIITGLLSALNGPNYVVDLCCGEGLLDEAILNSFSTFTIQGLDGSDEMLGEPEKDLLALEIDLLVVNMSSHLPIGERQAQSLML